MKRLSKEIDLIQCLEAWFQTQCDGDWEHNYGLSIETIDNPGWQVEVDLVETSWADLEIPFSRDERGELDWIQFEVHDKKFVGSGGISNLSEILSLFLSIVTNRP